MASVGSVVLSLDAELGWGFHDLDQPPRERVEAGRGGWEATRTILREYDVPATWAVVGHLMDESCDGRHADHPVGPDWFVRERREWHDRPDLRFAPDLVDSLVDSPVDHEIGSHSYSHVLFGDEATDRSVAASELERVTSIAREWGIELDSFVYPRNDVGHRDVLAEHGVRAYRGRTPTADGVLGAGNVVLRNRSPLVTPTVDDTGLVNVPASTFCFGFEGPPRTLAETVWEDPMVAVAKRGIEEAARDDGGRIFHLWFHPNNLVTERDVERVRRIVAFIDRARRETDLIVETMGDVARRVSTRHRPVES